MTNAAPRLAVVTALFAVYIFWGSTFAAMRYADASLPPFIMASMRFAIVGAIMFAFARLRKTYVPPTRAQWVAAAISGASLLLLGNGVVTWSVQYLPTGVVSLLIALTPLWMALFDYLFFRTRLKRRVAAGIVLGIIGMGLLVNPFASGAPAILPALALIGASIAWAFGSIYQRTAGVSNDLALSTAMQMCVGCGLLLAAAFATREFVGFVPAHVALSSWLGLGWLVVAGGLIGYSGFMWLMKHTSVPLASTYSYVNPVVAIAIGFVLFHERLRPTTIVAAVVILAGVALMLLPARSTADSKSNALELEPIEGTTIEREAITAGVSDAR